MYLVTSTHSRLVATVYLLISTPWGSGLWSSVVGASVLLLPRLLTRAKPCLVTVFVPLAWCCSGACCAARYLVGPVLPFLEGDSEVLTSQTLNSWWNELVNKSGRYVGVCRSFYTFSGCLTFLESSESMVLTNMVCGFYSTLVCPVFRFGFFIYWIFGKVSESLWCILWFFSGLKFLGWSNFL